MRIGVLSDTHNDINLAQEVLREMEPLDLLLHAGDHFKDGIILGERFKIKTKAVVGNCDFFCNGPTEEIINIGQYTILLTHGHRYEVKNHLQRLFYRSQEVGAQIVVFGHTHIPLYLVENGVHFLNPGSLTLPRGNSKPSYGLIILEKDLEIKLMELVK
ncbi:MAG: metallophosphoesterase [Clostridia bacterium]|nr:metallophosphoesterase [Clostridia bacterium]